MKRTASIFATVQQFPFLKSRSCPGGRRVAGYIFLLCLALTLSLPRVAAGQSGTGRIRGNVKQSSGGPIAQAIVTVSGLTTRSEMSDEDGWYEANGLAAGVYTVTVTRPGYVPAKQPAVEVKRDATVEVTFVLAPAPNQGYQPLE